jgi:hypothetical protein
MRIETQVRLAICGFLCAATVLAQDVPLDPRSSISIKFAKDSPVVVLNVATGESRATARGAALVLDLHMALTLRNLGASRIHGVTLRVVSQEVTLGGKGSVAYPSLNVGPGEAFPVRIDMQLVRPTQAAAGPLVEVNLDGVLFQDLSFYGPDRLNSRRTMTTWEMEAQRDREHFKRVLAQNGPDGLRHEMIDSLARQAERPQLDVRVARGGPAVSSAAAGAERTEQFAFLKFPDAPVEPVEGWAQLAGNEVRAPRIQVLNKSDKAVKYVELAWLVRDQKGQQYMAASLPAADPALHLLPGRTASVLQETALRFSRSGQPVSIQGMTGFVSEVEFADGKVWIPNRQNLENALLLKVLPPSNEEQRLSDLYRIKGIGALIEELKKF